jgi:hypothetical protein
MNFCMLSNLLADSVFSEKVILNYSNCLTSVVCDLKYVFKYIQL